MLNNHKWVMLVTKNKGKLENLKVSGSLTVYYQIIHDSKKISYDRSYKRYESDDNENTICQNLWKATKAMLR